jgi:hypothetical protein
MRERISKRFSLTQERGHEGHIRQVLHDDSRSGMYKVYDYVIYVKEEMS